MEDKKAKISAILLATAISSQIVCHKIQNLFLLWRGQQRKFQIALNAIFSMKKSNALRRKIFFGQRKEAVVFEICSAVTKNIGPKYLYLPNDRIYKGGNFTF